MIVTSRYALIPPRSGIRFYNRSITSGVMSPGDNRDNHILETINRVAWCKFPAGGTSAATASRRHP